MPAGRPKGALNKATAEVKLAAREHVPAVLKELARLATKAQSEAARVAAAKEILDRAYGKAPQAIIGGDDDDREVQIAIRWLSGK